MDEKLDKLLEDLERGSYASVEEARRARREEKKLMDEIAKAYYESLDEAGRARVDETRRNSEAILEMYRRGDEAEAAWLKYQSALSKPERDALRGDGLKYTALSRLFFGARSSEKLEQYAGMTVDELYQLAAEMDAAYIGDTTVDELTKLFNELGGETVGDMTVGELTKLAAGTVGGMTVGEIVKLAASLDAMTIGLQIRAAADALGS